MSWESKVEYAISLAHCVYGTSSYSVAITRIGKCWDCNLIKADISRYGDLFIRVHTISINAIDCSYDCPTRCLDLLIESLEAKAGDAGAIHLFDQSSCELRKKPEKENKGDSNEFGE